jgi:hypothetical protein
LMRGVIEFALRRRDISGSPLARGRTENKAWFNFSEV